MTNNVGWYVIYVKFRHEKKVHDQLLENGIDSFLPMVSTVRRWSDREKKILQPLFPCYLFVNVKSKLDFHNALSVGGACSYVQFGNEYGRVTQKEIEQIKLLVGGNDITDVQTNLKMPSVGDKIKIEHGELSGLECEVYRVDNVNKVSVWINALRQNISATIPTYYFQKTFPV
jgi:transcription antitermination factor NusG